MRYFEFPAVFYEVKGDKAAAFLHGQLTNSIKTLKNGEANYNLLLTLKGKVLADLYVYKKDDQLFFSCDPKAEDIIIGHLKKMAPLSRVTLVPLSDDFGFFHLLDDEAGFQTNRLGIDGRDIWIKNDERESFLKGLNDKGYQELTPEARETIRIESKKAKWNVDFNDSNLPQEALLDSALHFSKGCYLGQEIIARLHFKGHVNKILSLLKCELEVKVDDEILLDGKAVGKITSAVFSDKFNEWVALGYIPYKVKDSNQTFSIQSKSLGLLESAASIISNSSAISSLSSP